MISGKRQRPVLEYWALATPAMSYMLDLYPFEVARYARRSTINGARILGRFDTRAAAETRVMQYMQRSEVRARIRKERATRSLTAYFKGSL
jgi:hypothetical protein